MVQRKWLALCGIVGAILPVVVIFAGGNGPNDHASGAKVVSFYGSHKTGNNLAALLLGIAGILLVLFGSQLRAVLSGDRPAASVLSRAAFGGFVAAAATMFVAACTHLAVVDAAKYGLVGTAQALNTLDNYALFGVALAFSIIGLSAGFCTLAHPVLPRWLGWAAVVIGVVCLLGPIGFFGAALLLVWILVVAILMFRRELVPAAQPAAT
jgi:hypothetical protein